MSRKLRDLAGHIPSAEITPREVYRNRREILQGMGIAAGGLLLGGASVVRAGAQRGRKLSGVIKNARFDPGEDQTKYEDATTYNNFYEFGTGKEDPAENAHTLKTSPWTVKIEGEVAKPGDYSLEDILKPHALEERVYRHRCVEAWSMVIPWVGFPLGDLLKRFEPTSRAKYVYFETKMAPAEMPGQKSYVLEWPYREALRMDEAMHPLTLLAVGMYGETLPNQNGAPLRLVVPWKYGFKGIKSIVKIRLQETQPQTTWYMSAPNEYGFYSNVNPDVDHPRWSQSSERRIGDFLKRKTLPFNGYADQVASLYKGMDLKKYF